MQPLVQNSAAFEVLDYGFNTVNGKRVHATLDIRRGDLYLCCFNTVNGKRVHATKKIKVEKVFFRDVSIP